MASQFAKNALASKNEAKKTIAVIKSCLLLIPFFIIEIFKVQN